MRSISLLRRGVALIATISLAAGCSKVETQSSSDGRHPYTQAHTLRFAAAENLVGLNPLIATQSVVNFLSEMTMGYLVRGDAHSDPTVPELATSVPTQANGGISSDGKTITYRLRKDAKWSDGVPFTADDVVFTTKLIQDPKTNIVSRDGWDLIKTIDEPDKYTVVYHLSKPYTAYAVTFFSSVGANPAILPKHLLAGKNVNTDPYNSLPVGIGPFKYKIWKRGDSVELEPNPTYFRGMPKLQSVVYKEIQDRNVVMGELRTHELDLWIPVAPHYINDIRAIPNVKTTFVPSFYYDHMDFNTTHPVVSDPSVRRALRMAVNRPLIDAKIRFNSYILNESVVANASRFHAKIPLIPFDIVGANKLLDAAGWRRGPDGVRAKNGVRLSIDVATATGTPDADLQLELIRSWWKQIGADMQIKHYLASLLFAPLSDGGIIYGGKFDAVIFAWGSDPVEDLANPYSCHRFPPNGQNDARYCNETVTKLIERSDLIYDDAKRAADLDTIQRTIVQDAPVIVFDSRNDISAYNDDLKNWHPSSTGPFDDMMNVDI